MIAFKVVSNYVADCLNYQHEQSKLKYELNMSLLNFKYLIKTQRGLTELIKYLQSTWVATRRWQLNLIDSEAWQHQGEWGIIEQIEEEGEEGEEEDEEDI